MAERCVRAGQRYAEQSDHYGELAVKIDQQTDTTKLTLALDGVPKGSESDTERNLDTFCASPRRLA